MTKKLTISIPRPCHEDWDKMTSADKGRFCGSCEKEVIDFTSMSESQLIAFFKKPKGSVCGRFRNEQLEKDIYIRPKRMPWVKYFFQIVIPVFLLSCKQRIVGKVKVETTQESDSGVFTPTLGVVMTEFPVEAIDSVNGIKGEVNKIEWVDIDDMIVGDIKAVESENSVEVVDTAVLELPEIKIESGKRILCPDTISYSTNKIMGEVIAGVRVENLYDSIENKKQAPASNRLTVYPNPLPRNSNLKADLSKLPEGKYKIRIADMGGKIIYTHELQTDKFTLIEIPFSGLPGGMYVLRFHNERSGEVCSEKIVVQ